MGSKTLCIFMPTGKTFTFKTVKIVTDNETLLVFTYVAMSDNKKKKGKFQKAKFVGYSLTV